MMNKQSVEGRNQFALLKVSEKNNLLTLYIIPVMTTGLSCLYESRQEMYMTVKLPLIWSKHEMKQKCHVLLKLTYRDFPNDSCLLEYVILDLANLG